MIRKVRITGVARPGSLLTYPDVHVHDAETGQEIACSAITVTVDYRTDRPQVRALLEVAVSTVDLTMPVEQKE